jgi:hypothetical protein
MRARHRGRKGYETRFDGPNSRGLSSRRSGKHKRFDARSDKRKCTQSLHVPSKLPAEDDDAWWIAPLERPEQARSRLNKVVHAIQVLREETHAATSRS